MQAWLLLASELLPSQLALRVQAEPQLSAALQPLATMLPVELLLEVVPAE